MPATETRRSLEEIGRLGDEAIARFVTPNVKPEDDGKFVAIDIDSGDYELDEDDLGAINRLRARCPSAEVWLGCVGQPSAYKML